MLFGTFDRTELAHDEVTGLFGLEDRPKGDFSLLTCNLESNRRLEFGRIVVDTGIVQVGDLFGLYDLDVPDAVIEVLAVGAMHDIDPLAACTDIDLFCCCSEAIRSPPLVDVFWIGPHLEDQVARRVKKPRNLYFSVGCLHASAQRAPKERKDYSFLNEFTGLLWAAFSACVLTINSAKINAIAPVSGNIHHAIVVRIVYRSR